MRLTPTIIKYSHRRFYESINTSASDGSKLTHWNSYPVSCYSDSKFIYMVIHGYSVRKIITVLFPEITKYPGKVPTYHYYISLNTGDMNKLPVREL